MDVVKEESEELSEVEEEHHVQPGEKPLSRSKTKKTFLKNRANKFTNCTQFGKSLTSKHLNKHMRAHTGEKPFSCDHCGKSFSKKHHLQRHLRIHTGEKPYACDQCGKSYPDKQYLELHMRIHTGEKPFMCEHCEKRFSDKNRLRLHMKIHSGEKPFSCDQCGSSFSQKQHLLGHMRIHTGEKPYACDQCGKSFALKHQRVIHMMIHTGEKPFSCYQCGNAFRGAAALKTHLTIHTKEKPHSCPVCGKSFSRLIYLYKHEKIHTGVREYMCFECGKTFNTDQNLKLHQRIHTGEKPYKCSHCDKRFSLSTHLKTHERIHTGEKPYKCSQCDKRFSQSSHRKLHEKIHSRGKPHTCDQCGTSFSFKTPLNRHMKTHKVKKPHHHSHGHTSKMEPNPILNLILLGKKGAGKSSSGRTILGQHAFNPEKVSSPVAVESGTFEDTDITVYDTPGLIDTDLTEDKIEKTLDQVQQNCKSGLCAFLLVIKADRFTEEERKFVEKIEEVLGEERLVKTWILFTGGDQLELKNMTIKEFIDESKLLKKHLQKYDQRYHVFSNKKKGHAEIQVKMLLRKIFRTWWLKTPDGEKLTRRIGPNALDKLQVSADSLLSRRIVLLGKTGVGKSAAGNTILGKREFNSEMCTSSVTRECLVKQATVSGRSVSVVDTPGFFDTQMRPEELAKEIARSVYISSPGPHAVLVVLRVDDRFTEHEQQIPQMIEMMFGEEVLKYSIILFTRGDQLRGKSVEELIQKSCTLRHLVQECGGRFHVFNNEDENNRDQVNDLLKKIDTMVEQNGGGHYSNQMYEDAERFRQEEEERRQRGKECKETGFDKFHAKYEQTFSHSSKGLTLGGIIGGIVGSVAGPIGALVGAAVGAGIGGLVDLFS